MKLTNMRLTKKTIFGFYLSLGKSRYVLSIDSEFVNMRITMRKVFVTVFLNIFFRLVPIVFGAPE